MKSKWYHLKNEALSLRKKGASIGIIENKLKIPRSTLSGWFKDVILTKKQKNVLKLNRERGLKMARKKAILWHNNQKKERLAHAEKSADEIINRIDIKNKDILDLALAFLYLGEGFKINQTGLGNSDIKILKFFVAALIKNYGLRLENLKCELHLRADQNPLKIKRYWSKELNIPIKNFKSVSIDMRTAGRPTYKTYKGVCIIRGGSVAIQRKLLYLSKKFSEKIIEEMGD